MHKFPIFRNPEKYLETREPSGWKTRIKQRMEEKAIGACLEGIELESGILDAPCGPGRLFPIWKKYGVPVYGLDLSPDFVEFARKRHQMSISEGWVRLGDAYEFHRSVVNGDSPVPSLVASVRFIYYFPPNRRLKLLKAFSRIGSQYILTQYILKDSARSRWKRFRHWVKRTRGVAGQRAHLLKRKVRREDMIAELTTAGIEVLRIVPAGMFSDRFYVLGRFKRAGNSAQ